MLTIGQSLLLVIDVQGKLVSLMPKPEEYLSRVKRLITGTRIFKIPAVYSEQAPQKIGKTAVEIARLFKGQKPVEKISFSCCGDKKFERTLKSSGRRQIIVAGLESHVCVYQTVRDLLKNGYEVYVVADCLAARRSLDHEAALARMRDLGAAVTTVEMALCELMGKAAGPEFKEILNILKQD